ncbi:DUF3626 domain-containing protein [Agromyces salentinus]|uniref:DUF3626 domain-containing protein n=1 Tax=Agromyces salentinus TaxID=269421 RepID=A0ABP4YT50_9MICO|nr:DUF3626 domain-containing protein [Agromyces salentinus]
MQRNGAEPAPGRMDADAPIAAIVEFVRQRSSGGPLPSDARVCVHFHPDAPYLHGDVLDALLASGTYRSQYETGTSNGGLMTEAGRSRPVWERRMFGDAITGVDAERRPKYGALSLRDDPYGAAPRFGACFLRLERATLARTTFAVVDSVFEPDRFGTADRFEAIGRAPSRPTADPLDHYVEAHVHGVLRVADAEALVLDPSYRATDVEQRAAALGVPIEWHPGYELRPDRLALLPAEAVDYRGPRALELAREIAATGRLTPATLGPVRRDARLDAQEVKRVWHLLARYGRRSGGGTAAPS